MTILPSTEQSAFPAPAMREFPSAQSPGYFSEWLAMLDPDLRQAMVEPKSWLVLAAFVGAILTIVTVVPGVHRFFHLDAPLAAVCFLPIFVLGLTMGILQSHDMLSL